MAESTVTVSAPQEELKEKTEELAYLQQELAEKELLLSTCKRDLHLFEQHYNQKVGAKYAELDDIRALILELTARLDPQSKELKVDAQTAREEADQSAKDARSAQDTEPLKKKSVPTEELKKFFREVAKKIHPDLTTDKKERKHRHLLMARLNQAYDELDSGKIKAVLEEWEEGTHCKPVLTVGERLVKTIRQIAQVKERLQVIHHELQQLQNCEMFKLKERVDGVKKNGRDVIREMVADIETKISSVKSRIRKLSEELTYL